MKPRSGKVTRQIAENALSLVGCEFARELSQPEMEEAYEYAMREHLSASDNRRVKRRSRPDFIREAPFGVHLMKCSKFKKRGGE